MFYDPRMGSAITLTGQYIIQYVGESMDKSLNKFFKTDDVKYTHYSDTDSIFFHIDNIVRKYWSGQPDLKITDAIDKLMETKIRPFIDESTDHIAMSQNHYVKTIFFKRENICSSGFWLAKKKYALKVYDSEGVRYPDGDYKIMGIEVVRSSTPKIVRSKLKTCVEKIIDRDKDATLKLAAELKEEFLTANPSAIAFPRGANKIEEYTTPTGYRKGTPIQVRAAILYNQMIDKLGLSENYEPISSGDKIKFLYLKEPNTLKENVIGFVEELPTEFGLHKYIDRDMQYEKTFEDPLEGIFEAVGWKLKQQSTLEDLFE